MIIVSQDKKSFVNFDHIITMGLDGVDNEKVGYLTAEGIGELGTYKTEERAKEVLKEIVNTYVRECKTYNMPED